MSVTVSRPQNIKTIEGNGLAIYKDATNNLFTVKDVNGTTEILASGGSSTVTGTPNQIVVTPSGANFQVGLATAVTDDISQNTSDIATNTSDIATNTTAIATNTTDIATNTTDIATNTSDIATNTSNISTNTTAISTNTTDIATNTSDIATNTSAISTNTTDIATNTTDIATNTSDIATNTSDIATNTSNISTNATNITQADTNINILSQTLYLTWTGNTNPYFNFTNGVVTVVPWDTTVLNTDLGGNTPYSLTFASATNTTFSPTSTGFYEVSINIHFFDQFGDLDIIASLFDAGTSTQVLGLIDQKDVTGNTDSNFFGQNIVQLTQGTNYDIRVNFSGGSGQNPFPSNTNALPSSISVKRLV